MRAALLLALAGCAAAPAAPVPDAGPGVCLWAPAISLTYDGNAYPLKGCQARTPDLVLDVTAVSAEVVQEGRTSRWDTSCGQLARAAWEGQADALRLGVDANAYAGGMRRDCHALAQVLPACAAEVVLTLICGAPQ